MKKFKGLLAILVVFVLVGGCASVPLIKMDEFIVDLSLLAAVRNAQPCATAVYADVIMIDLTPALPDNIDYGHFNRMLIKLDFFDINGRPVRHDNDTAMISLYYDLSLWGQNDAAGKELFDRGGDPGPNVGNQAQKQFNVMGTWGNVHTMGCMIMLTKRPQGLLIQTAGQPRGVRFIELKQLIFYNDEVVEYDDGERM
ncbi:MAG: hypothetical protein FWD28_05905 [Treponema sp.]|nr:hypothetical protein [Treponema sp.]